LIVAISILFGATLIFILGVAVAVALSCCDRDLADEVESKTEDEPPSPYANDEWYRPIKEEER